MVQKLGVAKKTGTNFLELRQCRLAPSNYADILIMNIFDMARLDQRGWRP
jgi:hypothetical protein